MSTPLFRRLSLALLSTAFATSALAVGVTPDESVRGNVAAATAPVVMNPPLVNWTAPQFFNPPRGAFSSDGTFGVKGVMTKAGIARTLSTFIPVTPCRLVDTRNLFNPSYISPGPFGYREFRVYGAAGRCGIPAGNNRIQAVSVAVTTLPTAYSGDVEVIGAGQSLGGTVLMVIQAGLWNSATTATPVDSSGNFQVQVRLDDASHSSPTDLAIDVNGYYAILDAANPSDYFSIFGNYTQDGGLLNVTETGSLGAAISAVASLGTEIHLAQGGNAIDIVSGGIRVRGAGPTANANTPVFIHRVNAGAAPSGNICTDTRLTRLENPQTLLTPGLLIFAQQVGGAAVKPISVKYLTGGTCAPGSPSTDGWYLYTDAAFADGDTYNIMIIKP